MPPERVLWYNRDLPQQLGCAGCPDLVVCGGLRVEAPILDCHQLCSCARSGKRCFGVCRRDPVMFVARVNEVKGFGFENVPRSQSLPTRPLPAFAPVVYNGTDRNGVLKSEIVALPLLSLFNRSSGTGKFEDRQELLDYFRLGAGTRIILTGIDNDIAIERWWSFADRPRLIRTLRRLGVEMVTAPNYSLFTDVTRLDNLHNLKRIAIAWSEFVREGMPCAFHLNGRTDRDWERLGDFVAGRDEITHVSVEFTTGGAGLNRGRYHRDALLAIAARAGRPLRLLMRGGRCHLPDLLRSFASVTVMDSDPYVRAKYRRRARLRIGGDIEWALSPTPRGAYLDELLQSNVDTVRQSTATRIEWLRADYGKAESRHTSPLLEPRAAERRGHARDGEDLVIAPKAKRALPRRKRLE
jgi:hypothetical protein